MKNILVALYFFLPSLLVAQGVFNNGGMIVMGSGSFLTLRGNSDLINATSGIDGTIDNDGIISLQGSLINNAANTVFVNANSNGEVIFNGTAGQTISGDSSANFEKLVINNSTGVTLQQAVAVRNSLFLASGPLKLNSNTITVNNNSLSAISRTGGYIVSEQTTNASRIVWNIGSNTGAYLFPFGTAAGVYIPFTINLTAGDIGNVSVATYSTASDNTPYPVTPIAVTHVNDAAGNDNSANTVDRFWQLDKTGPTGTFDLTFTAAASEVGGITMLVAQSWNSSGSTWDAPLAGQTYTAVSATVPNVTDFSVWTLSGNSSPLPIHLLSFAATATGNNHVDLNWSTASETFNDYFTVEKTLDGINFETVAVIDGHGNSTQIIAYTAFDSSPYKGISYYRLKQTDFNGAFSYSNFVPVNVEHNETFGVAVFPNPVVDHISISIAGCEGKEVSVVITDASGREYYSEKINVHSDNYILPVNRDRFGDPGIYLVKVSDGDQRYTGKIIAE
jgi:hypothetical protein